MPEKANNISFKSILQNPTSDKHAPISISDKPLEATLYREYPSISSY